ncbi:MAG: DUF2225 domain-containing protein [bacterium]
MNPFWTKEIECPICKNNFNAFMVRIEKIKLKSRDSDLMGRYEEINPNWYDVWVCPQCFYASFRLDFSKLTPKTIELLRESFPERKVLAKGSDFKKERNSYLALISYQLGASCYLLRKNCSDKVASLFTKAAWLARENKSYSLEKSFLEKAVKFYKKSYQEEDSSSVDQIMVAYLTGEMERRLGNYEESLKYLTLVIYNRNDSKNAEIKRLAQDQYFLVKDTIRKSKQPAATELFKNLKKIDFFTLLTEKDLLNLAENIGWKIVDKDQVIINEGEKGDSFFIIREGRVRVTIKKDEKEKEITALEKNNFFGEMSLLTGELRSATVVTLEECELLIINQEHFAGIILKNPSLAVRMSRILVERQGRLDQVKRKEVDSSDFFEEKNCWNIFSLFLQIKDTFKF